jgi:hypothetical protein
LPNEIAHIRTHMPRTLQQNIAVGGLSMAVAEETGDGARKAGETFKDVGL